MSIVWFDFETTGLKIGEDEIIQAALVATTGAPEFRVREKLEVKIKPSKAGLGRLKDLESTGFKTVYDAETWRNAWEHKNGLDRMCSFMRRHADVKMVSKKSGKPYKVCRLAGHNIARFDVPLLYEEGRKHKVFIPAHPVALDTFQLASALKIIFDSGPDRLTIEALCKHYGIKVGKLHDALEDVCMNIEIGRRLAQELAEWE